MSHFLAVSRTGEVVNRNVCERKETRKKTNIQPALVYLTTTTKVYLCGHWNSYSTHSKVSIGTDYTAVIRLTTGGQQNELLEHPGWNHKMY